MSGPNAWIVKGATCKACKCPVVITQVPPGVMFDYWWYCINRACPNFKGKYTFDLDDEPEWCLWKRQ